MKCKEISHSENVNSEGLNLKNVIVELSNEETNHNYLTTKL